MPEPPTVSDAILARRVASKFDPDRPMPDDLLVRVLGLAARAPTGFPPQPWRFLVVRSERNRRRLRDCAFNHPLVTGAPAVVVVLGYKRAVETDLGPMLDHLVAQGAMSPGTAAEVRGRVGAAFSARSDAELAAWALRSATLAAATLMIAAEGLGVDSAFLPTFDAERIDREFGVPEDHLTCGLVALGFALEYEPSTARFGLEHLCFEEHFGQPWTLGEPPSSGTEAPLR